MADTLKEILYRAAKTARHEIRECGERSAIGEAAARNWQTYDNLLTAAGLFNEFKKWEAGEIAKSWEDTERTITLTNAQWTCLTTYLIMSTNYREGERNAWASLAEEKNPDGSPKFKHAANNAEYWQEVIDTIETIRKTIDAA